MTHKERIELAHQCIETLTEADLKPTKAARVSIMATTGLPSACINDLLKARRIKLGIYKPSLKGHYARLRTQRGASIKLKKNPSLLLSTNGVLLDKWEV